MTEHERYSLSLSFRDDGHGTDLALASLADGQDALLPGELLTHVDQCAQCTDRMTDFALASLALGRELTPPRPRPHPFPLLPVCAGGLVTTLPLVPALFGGPGPIAHLADRWSGLPMMLRGLSSSLPIALEASGQRAWVLSCLASGLLVAMGLLIARARSLTGVPALTDEPEGDA